MNDGTGSLPVVHVLLATYNGEPYLRAQWQSLQEQQGVRVVVHVADDGSADGTPALLKALASSRSGAVVDVEWMDAAPRRSATRSFLMLLSEALRKRPEARWFAYCDQDDVWLQRKLATAVAALSAHAAGPRPALYGGRTLAVDAMDRPGGLSPLFERPPSFANAIAQNIMGGNTMVMNRAAAELVAAAYRSEVVTHDWFTYQVVSGADGFISYDPQPFVRYRQHAGNVIGSNLGWRARFGRLGRMLRGEYRQWNDLNVTALLESAGLLAPQNVRVLETFAAARQARTPWGRVAGLRRSGVFRQTRAEHAMLWLACILRRM